MIKPTVIALSFTAFNKIIYLIFSVYSSSMLYFHTLSVLQQQAQPQKTSIPPQFTFTQEG